jgi:hypothetical protein
MCFGTGVMVWARVDIIPILNRPLQGHRLNNPEEKDE